MNTRSNVLAEVANVLQASPPDVKARLVSVMVERELVKRVDTLDKALVKRKELSKELDKIKPEPSYDAEGKEVPGNFTKAQNESRKKALEQLNKFDRLLEEALTNGKDFDKLSQMMGGNNSEGK